MVYFICLEATQRNLKKGCRLSRKKDPAECFTLEEKAFPASLFNAIVSFPHSKTRCKFVGPADIGDVVIS